MLDVYGLQHQKKKTSEIYVIMVYVRNSKVSAGICPLDVKCAQTHTQCNPAVCLMRMACSALEQKTSEISVKMTATSHTGNNKGCANTQRLKQTCVYTCG